MASDLDEQPPAALLLCGEATVPCTVLQRAITDAGFDVVCVVDRWAETVERICELPVAAAVVDLARDRTRGAVRGTAGAVLDRPRPDGPATTPRLVLRESFGVLAGTTFARAR